MIFKPKTLTLLSLLFCLFFLCTFVEPFFLGGFFFALVLGGLSFHVGLLKVVLLEGTLTLLDFVLGTPTRLINSVVPFAEITPALTVLSYSVLVSISMVEIVVFRYAYRRFIPKHFKLGY